MCCFLSFCLVVLLPLTLGAGGAHWNYQQAGHSGPHHWAGVCQDGESQSPINILTAEHVSLPGWIFTGYDETMQSIQLTNNGHSVKFSSSDREIPSVTGGDIPGHFVFAQGHFHWGNTSHAGSEHLIGGKAFPLELHLVHFNSKYVTIGESLKHADGLAVIGVMHEVSERDNPHLDPIIESLEHIKNAKDQVDLRTGLSLASLLPTQPNAFYRYSGSLTTPGCNEIVTWSVLHHPQAVSEQQLERLRLVLDGEKHPMGDNYRPVMPIHGRRVTITGLQPTVVITHNVVKGKKEVGAGAAHWNYQQGGHGAPEHWQGVCQAGKAQSPINIISPEHVSLPEWRFTGYDKTLQSIRLTNNGHSVKFSSSEEPTVTGGDLPGHFVFAQGHFHWGNTSHFGSEHLVGGKAFPLELHLVHFNSKYVTIRESLKHADGLAVIGVMHEVSEKDNPYLNPIIESLEHIKNAKDQVDLMPGFSLTSLLPTHSSAFYRYSGSLTTPGCNEIVTWSVLHHPQAVSEHQLERLRSVWDSDGHPMGENYRPVMPLHGRRVTVTGLEPTVVIAHKAAEVKKNVEKLNSLWYFNMVPGWAVVLIALAVGLNVGCLVFIMARRSGGHVSIPTEEF